MNHRQRITTGLFLCTGWSIAAISQYPKKMIIHVPVVNLRNAPEAVSDSVTLPTNGESNPLQCSQMLLGEYVLAHKEIITEKSERWLKISAIQQPKYDQKIGWRGFPGWIQVDQAVEVDSYPAHNLVIKNSCANLYSRSNSIIQTVSIGTRFFGTKNTKTNRWKVILPHHNVAWIKNQDVHVMHPTIQESEQLLRQNIVSAAMKFLDYFYSWGGRSAQCNNLGISSVDCSSFMQLVFLANGLQIPRNAHDQFLTARPVLHGKDLQAGDLVFFDPIRPGQKPPDRMSHVLLYLGDNKLIEATNSGERKIRIIPFDQRIGKQLAKMKSGDVSRNVTTRGKIAGQYHIYFGSYLNDPATTATLRKDALSQYLEIK